MNTVENLKAKLHNKSMEIAFLLHKLCTSSPSQKLKAIAEKYRLQKSQNGEIVATKLFVKKVTGLLASGQLGELLVDQYAQIKNVSESFHVLRLNIDSEDRIILSSAELNCQAAQRLISNYHSQNKS